MALRCGSDLGHWQIDLPPERATDEEPSLVLAVPCNERIGGQYWLIVPVD